MKDLSFINKIRGNFLLTNVEEVCRKSAIVLTILLPFLAPFAATNNINYQADVLILIGFLSIFSIFLRPVNLIKSYGLLNCILVTSYFSFLLISTLVNAHLGYNLFGAPEVRLGLFSLLSIGLVAALVIEQQSKNLSSYIFYILTIFNLSAIPYTLIRFHSIYRLGGLFSQADLMAVFIGLDIIFGLEMLLKHKGQRPLLFGLWLILVSELVITQTRAVIYLTIIICVLWYIGHYWRQINWSHALYIGLAVIALALSQWVLSSNPNRLTNLGYARTSVSYRLDLQQDALKSSYKKPVVGWGPGNLADALNCSYLKQAPLEQTCRQHFFFNSSHNIFIDRLLMAGYFGGLAYFLLVFINLFRAFRTGAKDNVYFYGVLLISAYYFTNVVNLDLELIFWLMLLAMIRRYRAANISA